jgi:hypothetical protein
MPFIAIMISALALSKRQIIALTLAVGSYALISINIAKPDAPNKASAAKVGIYIEKGYLMSDVQNRVK